MAANRTRFAVEPTTDSPANGKLIAVVGTPVDGDVPTWVAANSQYEPQAPGAATFDVSLPFIVDGGGSAITTGVKGDVEIVFAGTITAWRLFADQSGSIVIDTWKDSYANFPPTNADAIWGGSKPTLSSATKNQASGLSVSLSIGDVLRFNVDSASTVTRVTLSLTISRTI